MSAPWVSLLRVPENTARGARIERAEESFTVRGMFFASILNAVRKAVDPAAALELASKAGVPVVDYGGLRKYPMRDFLKLQTVAAQRLLHVLGSVEEGIARTGAAAVEDFFESVGGRTMKVLAGRDPHRLFSSAPNAYPLTVVDNGKRDYKKTGETSGVFTFENDMLGPSHNAGVFLAAIKDVCDIVPNIEIDQADAFNYKFKLSW